MTLTKIALAALLLSTSSAHAESNDFGRTDTKLKAMTAQDLRKSFELIGEVFIVDPKNGRLLHPTAETRLWRFGKKNEIVSNFSFQSPDIKPIALAHKWEIKDDGRILGHIKQFESMEPPKGASGKAEVKTGKLIKEQNVEIKDFGPVSWVAQEDGKIRVVVRFLPKLQEAHEPIQADGGMPITLRSPLVFDSKGRLWARGSNIEGKYLAMKTHLGMVALSYLPFKGAKPIGTIQGSQINLDDGSGTEVTIRSEQPILASNRPAAIYGFIDVKRKTAHPGSVGHSSSSGEKEFLDAMDD